MCIVAVHHNMSAQPSPQAAQDPATASSPAASPSNLFPQAKGESDRAFEAFRAYLELGPKRRYLAVGRKVGASLRTIKRWASDFDWRGRVKSCAAQAATQYLQVQNAVQREELLDAAARAKTLRDRQYALAEALLDTAERYLERLDEDDLDQLTFAGACKALEVASRLAGKSTGVEDGDASAAARALRDQLAVLLDQACHEALPSDQAQNQPPGAATSHPSL